MQKGKEWMDEREGALMCFTFFYLHEWNQSGGQLSGV